MIERWLWTQKEDIGAPPRYWHAMAYDTVRKRVVTFGGVGEDLHGDRGTWEWDGIAWTQVADIGPSPRMMPTMTYDIARSRLVLFGGFARLRDTWEWDGADWTQVADIGPSARYNHTMAYDVSRHKVVLHGGSDNATVFQDTWEWDGTEWQQIAEAGPRRLMHAMVFDIAQNCLWAFGGLDKNPVTFPGGSPAEKDYLADTWEFSGGVWTKRQDMGPGPMETPAMVYAGTRTVLFGGGKAREAGSTWEWNGSRWTKRQNMGPAARTLHAMAYDSERDRVVLFGGHQTVEPRKDNYMGDTWELAIAPEHREAV